MDKLATLKALLGNPPENDAVLQFYLDDAGAIICDIRNSNKVEPQYDTIQVKIAVELYSKRGAEGEVLHSENGISRTYEASDVSPSLLKSITPMAKTPFSIARVINI